MEDPKPQPGGLLRAYWRWQTGFWRWQFSLLARLSQRCVDSLISKRSYNQVPGLTRRKVVWVILWSLLCFPVGLWWLWRDPVFPKLMRVGVTILALAFVGFANLQESRHPMPRSGGVTSRGSGHTPEEIAIDSAFQRFQASAERLAGVCERKGWPGNAAGIRHGAEEMAKLGRDYGREHVIAVAASLHELQSDIRRGWQSESDAEARAAGKDVDDAIERLVDALCAQAAKLNAKEQAEEARRHDKELLDKYGK